MWLLTLIAALIPTSIAAISDLNCTSFGKYDKTAVNCQNKYPNKECENLFGKAVEVNTETERADKCFKNSGGTADEQMKQLAISACPLTCGYCCLTPAYKCTNKQFPRIACAALTSDMCKDPTWKQIIAEDCPNVCGFCQEGEIHKVFLCL
ncbi:shTK domain protein [Oesophagostomum dentatum]|uniref:ShTK domain protein n=1 Tax=Oesophagostomum dentatum TaxID=61180 RepID=A0A0B1S4S9_OESDE|nr:shTK domain protein [Oesophagostomum dentatum]